MGANFHQQSLKTSTFSSYHVKLKDWKNFTHYVTRQAMKQTDNSILYEQKQRSICQPLFSTERSLLWPAHRPSHPGTAIERERMKREEHPCRERERWNIDEILRKIEKP